jgi:hypothetical protein
VTKGFTGCQRIDLDGGTAVLTISAQVVQSLEPSAFALPVTDLILDEIERRSAAEIGDGENGLEHSLESGVLALFRQEIHLQKTVVGLALNFD